MSALWNFRDITWCGTCREHERTVYGEPCPDCHPATLRDRVVGGLCGMCDRESRLLTDDTRCPDCHPFADYGINRYRRLPWCKRCDWDTRYEAVPGGPPVVCRRCHPLGSKPMQWPALEIPSGFIQEFLACDWLCFISPTLRRVGTDRLRLVLRPWFHVGYTPKDIEYALDNHPGGILREVSPLTARDDPRVIETWIGRRLRNWMGEDGHPLPSVSVQIHHKRDVVLQQQQRLRAEHEQTRRNAVDARRSRGAAEARAVARTAAAHARQSRSLADRQELSLRQAGLHEEQQHRRRILEALQDAYPDDLTRRRAGHHYGPDNPSSAGQVGRPG